MNTICVIPARYASTRLPGKPLKKIGDKPMIELVYKQALQTKNIDRVIVATDDDRIFNVVKDFGGTAVMTDPELPSGTDRVYEAIKNTDTDIVINLQGDEPFVAPELLEKLVNVFHNDNIQIATPICEIENDFEITDPNVVKVIKDVNGFALYFSRSQIPFLRDFESGDVINANHTFYKHIGIYAYRKECLKQLTQLDESSLEKIEKLEQLRFLENGFKIYTVLSDYNSIGVDTPEDLKKINKMIQDNVL